MSYNTLPERAGFIPTSSHIKPEIESIIDRSIELNEVIKDTSFKLGDDKRGLARALGDLKFSEKIIKNIGDKEHLKFSEHQFSGDGFIGNYTSATLDLLIQEVGSNLNVSSVLSLAFPDKSVPEDKIMLDRIAGNNGIAGEMGGYNSPIPTVQPLNTWGLEYQAGLWGGRTFMDAKTQLYFRKRGASDYGQRGIGQYIGYNSINLITQTAVRKNKLTNDMIFLNSYSYGGTTISSNIPSGNTFHMQPMGTLNTTTGQVTYNNVDPYYTPVGAIANILNTPKFIKYRKYIRGVVVNGADLQAIMNHPNIKAVTNAMVTTNSAIGEKKISVIMDKLTTEITSYYAPGFEFPLIADDTMWEEQTAFGVGDDTAQNFFVPRGKMYVLMDLSEYGGQSGAFHLTLNEIDPNVDSPAMGLYTGVFQRNLNNSDVTNRLDIVAGLAGGPALYRPEAQFTIDTLYSSISA